MRETKRALFRHHQVNNLNVCIQFCTSVTSSSVSTTLRTFSSPAPMQLAHAAGAHTVGGFNLKVQTVSET